MQTGVLTDVLNLVFRDKPTGEVPTGETSSTTDSGTKRREMIIPKCLQFLRSLAR